MADKKPFNLNEKSAAEGDFREPKLPAFPSQGGETTGQERQRLDEILRKTGRFPPEAYGEPTPTATPSMPRDVGPQGLPSRGPTDRRPVADGPTVSGGQEEVAQPSPLQAPTSPEGPRGAGRTPFFDVYTDEVAARVVQEDLAELGYTSANGRPLRPDGSFGRRSTEALMKFQRASGLPEEDVTGEWNRNTSILLEQAVKSLAARTDKLDSRGRPEESMRPSRRGESEVKKAMDVQMGIDQDPRGESNEYTKDYPPTQAVSSLEPFDEKEFVTYPDKTFTHSRQIKPTKVMVHHTGSSSSNVFGTVKTRGLRVHYAVQPDGTVEKFMDDTTYGAHAGGGWNQGGVGNSNAIGIEFVGSNDGAITQEQIDAGARLLPYLVEKNGLNPEDVVGQMEVSTHKQAGEGARILWEYSKAQGLDRPNYFSIGSGKRLRDWVIYGGFDDKDAEKTWENWSIEKDGVTYSGWSGAQDLYDKEAETVGDALVAAGYTNDQKGMKKYLADSDVKLPSKVGAYRLSNSLAVTLLSGKSKEPEKTDAQVEVDGTPTETYSVVGGDSFGQIAASYGVSSQVLQQMNPQISNPSSLQVGQQLNVPLGGGGHGGITTSHKDIKFNLPKAKQLGMIGGVRDQNRVWQSFGSSGMAHSTDYRDYSQLFREYTTTKKNGYYPVGKDKDGRTVYAAPDYHKDKDGNYVMVSKDDAIRLAEEYGSLIPQRDWVKKLYGGAIKLRMPTQPIYKTGGEGDSAKYTAAINAAIKKNKKYKQGSLIVHGKEFFVSK